MKLIVRPLKTPEDGRAIEEITMAAWGSDSKDVIPFHLSFTVAKENGGVVLIAFDGDRPIGFCWGFWAYVAEAGRWKCASHMAAVIPEYKGRGIGEKIKWAQQEYASRAGFDQITWTYDPLETLNGTLNIRKLGAVCSEYFPNLYGDLDDDLNKGFPTDRFRVDWWVTSYWVAIHKSGKYTNYTMEFVNEHPHLCLNPTSTEGLPEVISLRFDPLTDEAEPICFVSVPRHFQKIKGENPELALTWRFQTRELFQKAFSLGLTVIDLVADDDLCYYILEKHFRI
ncbi:MAG: GNAT family N-acetyltransferase [Ardenticatenaceae bacterium]|nr:GNAT family N-acetyltransferase [Ardenticatenaceae bacterium]